MKRTRSSSSAHSMPSPQSHSKPDTSTSSTECQRALALAFDMIGNCVNAPSSNCVLIAIVHDGTNCFCVWKCGPNTIVVPCS